MNWRSFCSGALALAGVEVLGVGLWLHDPFVVYAIPILVLSWLASPIGLGGML